MVVIGDVHGKTSKYYDIIRKADTYTVQIGDFGFKPQHDWHRENVFSENNKILFGNHDYYPYLNAPHSVTDSFLFDPDTSTLYIRGAFSIDRNYRTPGEDWFENEELSIAEFYSLLEKIKGWKPYTIISHDCPAIIYKEFFQIYEKGSRTSQGLQACFESWAPGLWVFGHHHRSIEKVVEGTRFVCLAELETIHL